MYLLKKKLWHPPNWPDESTAAKPSKLLDQVRDKLRVKHYSIRTEQTYVDWIKRYIFFHGKRLSPRYQVVDIANCRAQPGLRR